MSLQDKELLNKHAEIFEKRSRELILKHYSSEKAVLVEKVLQNAMDKLFNFVPVLGFIDRDKTGVENAKILIDYAIIALDQVAPNTLEEKTMREFHNGKNEKPEGAN